MKKLSLLFIIFCIQFSFSQEHAWVYFKDKPDTAIFLENPLKMLTQKALDRRTRQNISLDAKDIPISEAYLNTIATSLGITIKAKSKWLNALHIFGSEQDINSLLNLSFVDHIEFAANDLNASPPIKKYKKNKFEQLSDFNYGGSANQIEMLKGDVLHQQDYTGSGITIAVMDGGFPKVNTLEAFKRMRDRNLIKGGYDFVQRNSNFYTGISHGTSVLSTMAGFVDGQLIGTAPDADYYLFITEDGQNETPLEESLWVEAAEKADSLGVDIINTSLGYNTFDDAKYDYNYADMNGTTAFISRGANLAFTRGMLIVVSAGNEGVGPWHYIAAPADAANVLSVGAVDENNSIADFSSYGPTADGRVKPDVTAKGRTTTIVNGAGAVVTGNGTSFASPVICGVIACLWQANPNKTNIALVQAIKESAHLFTNPTDQEGFGIPNFETALKTLPVADFSTINFQLYPNPFQDQLQFVFTDTEAIVTVSIYSILGKKFLIERLTSLKNTIDTKQLPKGLYILHIVQNKRSRTIKIIKS